MRNGAERIRVFHLIKSLGRGGAEVLLAEGLAVADRERFEYSYGYFLPWKQAVVHVLERQGASVVCFDAPSGARILLSARQVARHLRRERIDLVHAHLPVAGAVARIAGRMAGVPVVYTEHNLQSRYHRWTRRVNRLTWNWQAYAIAVSAEVEASIRKCSGERVPVQTVLNGVNTDTYCRTKADGGVAREQWGIPANAPVVGTVAVFRPQKRLQDWLRVAKQVHAARPDVHFLLVGDGVERPRLEELARQLGLAGVVHFAGLQEEARPYFAAMDVYLMTSEFEGLPVALLEAMSMQVAPVVTAVGGIPEAVVSGENGYVREVGALERLTGDVLSLLAEPVRLREMAAAARQTVERRFSMTRMQRMLESIYGEVIARR
jgi:L-malate glycosyltransferase